MRAANPDFFGPIQGVTDRAESTPQSRCDLQHRIATSFDRQLCRCYSAAATNDGFLFAADNMKSEMRGTISDLKREPLKTP